MWPYLTFLAVGLAAAVWIGWRRRCVDLEQTLARQQRELEALRQQHDQARSHEQAQQEALFNSMAEGVLLLDRTGRVRLVNRALEHLFGLTADIRGRTLMEAFRSHQLQEMADRAQAKGEVSGGELEGPAGRCLEVNAAGFADATGQPQGVIVVFHDLTALKQLENTRQEFVANVSHELRTPLSLIKGYVETLIDGAKDRPDVASRFLEIIDKHVDRLTFLIEDLLTISRLESGQVAMNFQPLDLGAVAQRVLDDLQARAAEKKMILENEIAPALAVRADTDRLQQVFFNLVDNAIKYGRTEGRVRLSARPHPGGLFEISVKDDGPGIPPDAVDRVFERFYRVDRARSRETGGTGLGLAIVKHIVQAHGGEVWAESKLGHGTTFFFTLPAEGEQPSHASANG